MIWKCQFDEFGDLYPIIYLFGNSHNISYYSISFILQKFNTYLQFHKKILPFGFLTVERIFREVFLVNMSSMDFRKINGNLQ